jgi:hypothetical protein
VTEVDLPQGLAGDVAPKPQERPRRKIVNPPRKAAGNYLRGITKLTMAPCSGPGLSAQTAPSCSSTNFLVRESPSPVPWKRRVVEPSPCSKGSKILS